MYPAKSYAALSADKALEPFQFSRPSLWDYDILIDSDFFGKEI